MPATTIPQGKPRARTFGTHEVLTLSQALVIADAAGKDESISKDARDRFRAIAGLIRKACE